MTYENMSETCSDFDCYQSSFYVFFSCKEILCVWKCTHLFHLIKWHEGSRQAWTRIGIFVIAFDRLLVVVNSENYKTIIVLLLWLKNAFFVRSPVRFLSKHWITFCAESASWCFAFHEFLLDWQLALPRHDHASITTNIVEKFSDNNN